MEVLVEFDYEALHEDELTLRLGDVIKNVRYIEEDGWMEGDLNGRRGLFPDNFVKEIKKDSKEVKEAKIEPKEETAHAPRKETSGNVANLVHRMSTIGIPTGGFQPHPPAASKKPKRRQCKAQFDYQPLNEDELELKVGDVIDILEEVEEGWWSGSLNGKSGLFPSNFVKEVDAAMSEDAESNDAPAEDTDGSAADGNATPTSPPPDSGNGVIAHPKKITGVGFGDIFKGGTVKLKPRVPSSDTEDKKERPIPSLPYAAKPAHPIMTDSQKGDKDRQSKEYCKVTFAFEATNEDELSLKVDDIIHVLSKDTGEPGWWRGEIGGREGVFPDNFVIPVPDGEISTPPSKGSLKASPKPETEEKPKKPPPPLKNIALKPEVPSADRKPHFRPEDRDKPTPDHRPSKPAAPMVPPKKPVPLPGKGRTGSLPPKRPDKPLAPSPILKHNGEVPSTRPKSDYEPLQPTKPKTLSGDWGEKSSDGGDLMSFDDLSASADKLFHPTANRPKMPGRRLPGHHSGGHSPNKDVSVEKCFKADEEDAAKAKPTETRKPSTSNLHPSPSLHRSEAKPSSEPISKGWLESEEPNAQLDELRSQFKELLMSVELLKTEQMKEITDLRRALEEEVQKRVALQTEIESLKRTVHST